MLGSTSLAVFTVIPSTMDFVVSSLSTDSTIMGPGMSGGFPGDETGVGHSFDGVIRIRGEVDNGSCF